MDTTQDVSTSRESAQQKEADAREKNDRLKKADISETDSETDLETDLETDSETGETGESGKTGESALKSGESAKADESVPQPDELRALKEAFADLLQRLEKDEQVIDTIRLQVLNNLVLLSGDISILDQVQAISEKKGYRYAYAVCCIMRFYFVYMIDLDAAIAYNEEGRRVMMEIPDYSRKPAYLSMLNNAILGNTARHDYVAAYRDAMEALKLCDPESNITTYCALLNNTAAILSDIGLHKKALKQLECSMGCIDLQSDYNAAATRFRYAETLLCTGQLDVAEEQLLWLVENQSGIFPWQFYPSLIRIACQRKDEEAMEKWRGLMIRYASSPEQVSFEQRNVLFALALIDAHHHRYEQAEKLFLQVFDEGGSAMLSQSELLRELAHLYEAWGKPEKAVPYYCQLDEMNRHAMHLADEILEFELEGGRDVFIQAGETLFQRIRSVTLLGQRLIDCLSYPDVLRRLRSELAEACPFDLLELAVMDTANGGLFLIREDEPDGVPCGWLEYSGVRHLVETQEMLNLRNVSGQADALPPFVKGQVPDSGSVLLIPVCYKQQVAGVLALYHHETAVYGREHQEVLHMLCSGLGVALQFIGQYQSVVESSMTDPLTGILNRSGLRQCVKDIRLKMGGTLGVLLMDIDDFKKINDVFGHDAGDDVLRQVAAKLSVWAAGAAVRYGGDEFLTIIPTDRSETLQLAAEELLELIRTQVTGPDGRSVTLSIGGAVLYREQQLEDAVQRADMVLYEGKRRGKACALVEGRV